MYDKEADDSKQAAMWRAVWLDMWAVLDLENKIDKDRARVAAMRREHAQAIQEREAMIDAWFRDIGNLDIAMRVRELAREAGPDVIDLIEYRREPAKHPKKKRRFTYGRL